MFLCNEMFKEICFFLLKLEINKQNYVQDSDNYIPRYDDLPKHSHPSLNHARNKTHFYFNSTNEEVPLFNDNGEDTSTPFVVNLVTNVDGIPTIELISNIENDVKNDVIDTEDNLFSDFDEIGKTPSMGPKTTSTIATSSITVNSQKVNILKSTEPTTTTYYTVTQKNTSTVDDLVTENNKFGDFGNENRNTINHEDNKDIQNSDEEEMPATESPSTKIPEMTVFNNTFNISDVDSPINETTRNPREEAEKDDPEFADKESNEDASSEEEEDMNMITGLLSALLGGLSKPDGSIDLEAIVGLVGSLSTQNDDGTYDFQGLTELLKGFFGGDGGGSDIGAFTGGLLGAVIKGIASPPGGKGVGILSAKILAGILPALSVQPAEDGKPSLVKPGGLDIGGLLGGFVKTVLGASKGINPVKFVISTITSLSNSKPTQPKGKDK